MSFLLTLAVVIGGISLFNFVVDPFQVFRIPQDRHPAFFGGMQRYQNVGLARNYVNGAVIIGSSITENFYPSFVSRIWKMPATKLSISGSTAHEQYLILREALRTGRVRSVLWGLDAGAFYRAHDWVRDDQAPFPYFMYRWPPIFNLEYLFSMDTTRFSLYVLHGYGEKDLERLDTWDHRFKFSADVVLHEWVGTCDSFKHKYSGKASPLKEDISPEMKESVNRNLIEIISAYPNVEFYLYFPPTAMLGYIPSASNLLPVALPFRTYVVNALENHRNVNIFDFQVVSEITFNLDNYKDPVHFSRQVSEYLVESMKAGRHRVTEDTISTNNANLIAQVNGYDLCAAGSMAPAPGLSFNR